MQRIGESRCRLLELCWWPDQAALPAKGKEYPGLGLRTSGCETGTLRPSSSSSSSCSSLLGHNSSCYRLWFANSRLGALVKVDADGVFRAAPWFGTALSVLAASGVRGVAVDVWCGEHDPDLFFTDRPREGAGRRNREYLSIWADEAAALRGRTPLQCYEDFMQAFCNNFHQLLGSSLVDIVVGAGPCGELRYPAPGGPAAFAGITLHGWPAGMQQQPQGPGSNAGERTALPRLAQLTGSDIPSTITTVSSSSSITTATFLTNSSMTLMSTVAGGQQEGWTRQAYVESNGWKFPGVGEFQCYDRRALACLAQAAREAGHPEWGYGGPHNAGDYASWPEDTDFFRVGGAWETEYGRFFLGWYSACLLRHADQLLAIAKRVLLRAMTPPTPPEAPPGTHCPPSLPPNTLSLPPPPGAPPPPLQFTQVQPEQPHHSIATPGCGIAGNGPPAPPPLPHTTLPLLALDLSILHPPPGPEGLRATTSPLGLLSSSSSSISRGLSCNSAGVAGAESDFAQLSTRSLPLLPSALLPGHPTPAPSTTPLRSPPRHRTHSQLRSPPPSSQFQHSSADLLALTSHSLTAACSEPGGGEGEESGAGEEGEEEYGQAALGLLQGAQALSQRLALVAKAEELGSPAAAAAAAAAHPAQLSTASAASSRYASSNGRPGGWVAASAGTSPHSLPQIMIPALARMPQHQHQQQPQQQQGHCPPPSHTAAHAAPPAALQQQEQQRQVARSAADPPPPLTAPLAASSIRSGARGEQQASPSPSPPFPPPVLLPVASPDQAAGSSSGSSSAGLARPHLPSPLQRISCASGGQQQQQQPTPGGTLLPREPPPPPPWGSQQQPTCTTPPAAPPGAGGSMGGSSGSSSGGAAPGSGVSSSLPPGCVGGVQGYQGVPADCGQGSGSCLPLTDSAADMMALGGRRGGSGHPCLHQGPPPPPLAPALPELPGQAQQQQQQQQQQAPGPRQAGAGQQPSPQAECWWYRTRSHAAELTAGYYNTATHDGYAAILQVCARHSARLTLTCVEMCDAQHAQHAQCGPEGLLKQIRLLAARYAVPLAGENALPIFLAGGVDAVALDRIVFNTRAWYGPSSAAAAARHYLHQQQLRAQQEQEQQQQQQHDRAQHQEQQHDTGQQQEQQQQQRGLQQNGGWVGALGAAAVVAGEHDSPQVLGWGYPEAGWGNGPPSSSSTAPPARYPTTHPPAGASACTWLPSLATQSALDPPPGRPAGLRAWGSLPPGGALHCPLPPQPTPQPQGLSSSSHAQGASGEGHSSSQQVSPPGGQASQGGRGLSRQPVLGRLRHVPTAASLTAIIGLAEGAAGLGGGGVAGGGAGPQGGGWSLSAAAVATGGTSTQQQQQQQLRAQQPTTLRQAQEALGRLEARQGGAAASTASSPGPSPASCTPPCAAWCALGHGWGSGGEKGDLGLGRPGEQSARVAASGLRSDSYADIVEPLPSLASFTLLRLGPELLLPSHQPPWLRFMTRMQQGGYVPC
ncbi:hypothetical protein QJQ45_009994 [Haematococcus lacustris]|nr:hypothetical protein QJQ45_009994 [Haematococcus lacustris]